MVNSDTIFCNGLSIRTTISAAVTVIQKITAILTKLTLAQLENESKKATYTKCDLDSSVLFGENYMTEYVDGIGAVILSYKE